MPADFKFVQGDDGPPVTDTLTFKDGTAAPLTGATITPLIRALTADQDVQGLSATVTVTNTATGGIQWSPTAADTALLPAGAIMLKWLVAYTDGQHQTFPTDGYLWGFVEPKLNDAPRALVSLPDAKDYINANGGSADRSHDDKLLGFIYAATPLIENTVGPVIVRTFEEWHSGGQYFIQLRRKPSFALGTNPVLNIIGCDEYRGPVKYPLSVIADPTQASIYSVMLDQRLGTLYRRTTGGGVIPFGAGLFGGMPQAVHVLYQAGQQTVPDNVRMATLETVRWNFESSQPTGLGSRALVDTIDMQGTGPRPFAMPPSAMQYLAPMRRHPAIA